MRIVVLADTHRYPPRRPALPGTVVDAVRRADAVLHAGDHCTPEALAELEELAAPAPVHAVLGNNDRGLADRLPVERRLEIGGVRVGLVHDSGRAAGRAERLRRRFPDADVVVFGHSHRPHAGTGVDGQRLLNPGSPTQRRAAPEHTFAVLDVGRGRLRGHEIVAC